MCLHYLCCFILRLISGVLLRFGTNNAPLCLKLLLAFMIDVGWRIGFIFYLNLEFLSNFPSFTLCLDAHSTWG